MIYIRSTKSSYNRRSLIKLFLDEKPETFSDAECTQQQCRAGAYRSVTEIWEIVKTYFPVTSLEGVLRIIADIIDNDKRVEMVWCTQVNKVVLKYNTRSNVQEGQYATKYSLDRYSDKKGLDGYSLNDYLKIIKKLKSEK